MGGIGAQLSCQEPSHGGSGGGGIETLWALLPLLVVVVGSVVVGSLWGPGTSMRLEKGWEWGGAHASPLMVAEGALTPLWRGHPVREKEPRDPYQVR